MPKLCTSFCLVQIFKKRSSYLTFGVFGFVLLNAGEQSSLYFDFLHICKPISLRPAQDIINIHTSLSYLWQDLNPKLCKTSGKPCTGKCGPKRGSSGPGRREGEGEGKEREEGGVPLHIVGQRAQWFKPTTLDALYALLKQYRDANYRLVFGNTGYGQSPCLFVCVCVCLSVCLSDSVCQSCWLAVLLAGWLSFCLCMPVCLYISLSVYVCLSVYACLYVCISVCLLFVWLSVCVCVCLLKAVPGRQLPPGLRQYWIQSVIRLFCLSGCLCVCACVCLSVCLSVVAGWLFSVCLSWLVGWLSVYLASWLTLSVCLSWLAGWLTVCLAGCVCVCLIVYLAVSLAGWLSFWMDG